MDRFAAMIILLGVMVSLLLMLLALFAVAPITCSCLASLLYTLYVFVADEESSFHQAQEFENRFWTIFAMLFSTALFFAKDSPLAFGHYCSPTLGFIAVLLSSYAMHIYDRYVHRVAISQETRLRRITTPLNTNNNNNNTLSASDAAVSNINQSLLDLRAMGIPVEQQLQKINECMRDIDQLLIPSTINNFINQRFILSKEREIINVFEECDARALNYLISHVKLGLIFYKVKDHRHFNGKHRTELINLLAVERLSILSVISRVIVLHSLQLLKLRASPRAEYWVRNILLNTYQDDLSELKTLTDSKGDYFCMNKLIFDDIRSESIRQDILNHFCKQAAVQQTHTQMGTRRSATWRRPPILHWRKILSDVDDTLFSSGGMYPAGVDRRYPKKTVYPGVLAFYRELDLGTQGPEEWPEERVGNLVFLSARPHVYKDMSEKANFAKFEKLKLRGIDGRKGLHTTPSLLSGDIASGKSYIVSNDFGPLAKKKFDNFRRYVSIYPEYQHVFVCDNGQGDVRAGEMMFDSFPYEFEHLYVHVVMDVRKTYGYEPERWRQKEFRPFFFHTYPEAALHAATQKPPLIRMIGLRRICMDTVKDFAQIKIWFSEIQKAERRLELNQAIWRANDVLVEAGYQPVDLIKAEQRWANGQKVRTPYGIATIISFDPVFDNYEVELDWRPLDVQVAEHIKNAKSDRVLPRSSSVVGRSASVSLATVPESEEADDDQHQDATLDQVAVALETNSNTPRAPVARVEEPRAEETRVVTFEQSVGQSSAESRGDDNRQIDLGVDTDVDTDSDTDLSSASTLEHFNLEREPSARSTTSNNPVASNTIPVVRQIVETLMNANKESEKITFRPKAFVNGRFISKYTQPVLPRIEIRRRGSVFTFLSPTSDASPKPLPFAVGDECTTPYGPGRVVEIKKSTEFVVVEMVGWEARAYLRYSCVKVVPSTLFKKILKQFSASEATVPKPLEFPYALGTTIKTPYGVGTVCDPLPVPSKNHRIRRNTIGIHLTSWILSDGTHPTLYCTVAAAKEWKDRKDDLGRRESATIFATLGTLVSKPISLLEPIWPSKKTEEPKTVFKQYYKDSAAVSTAFGDGRVVRFRESDGFYEVELTKWKLSGRKKAMVYLRKEKINYRLAAGCQEGYPVLTSLGLSGTLASVEPTTGVHLVTISNLGIVCYLQPECVLQPLKAAAGEEVSTPFGEGRVVRYNAATDTYEIKLKGWNATLYSKSDNFDRVGDGIQDRDAPFGVNWFLRFLFYSSKRASSQQSGTRSRSNSLVSGSLSNRSLT